MIFQKYERIILIITAVLLAVVVYFITREIYKEEVKPVVAGIKPGKEKVDTVWRYDTLQITHWKPKLIPVIDTVYLDSNKTPQLKATADTSLVTNFGDTVKVKTAYYLPPLNYFDQEIKLSIKERYKTRVDTAYVTIPGTFWDRFKIGIGAGGSINFKDGKVYPSINAGIFYAF